MEKHGAQRERLLELLAAEGGLTAVSAARVAAATGVPEADVWGAGSFYRLLREPGPQSRVCMGLSCRMAGSAELLESRRADGDACEPVSCLGQCDRAPAMLDSELELRGDGAPACAVMPDDPDLPINLAGTPNAAYAALERARDLGKQKVLEELEAADLRGRGGAGFPAHLKWQSVTAQPGAIRYVVCNADEGEPGTFKDREVMLRRPHRLLEGLGIAAHTVGARDVYLYIRGEFQAARRALQAALAAPEATAALADLTFHFVAGHGAYICGEETALLESLEGRRGMPRLKPPFPTERGFRGQPTLIHNVESLACLPAIVTRGGEWFRSKGRTGSGTKLYSISGHVGRPGVYELPLGVSLDELVEVAGGYVGEPRAFSPGGASSGFLPLTERQRPLDFASLQEVSSMLGSGGVVVLNDTVDLVEAVRWQLAFFSEESCGQCAPCRIGTRILHRQLSRFLDDGDGDALWHVDDVAWEMQEASICGLGMAAPAPLQSARRHFPELFAPARRGES